MKRGAHAAPGSAQRVTVSVTAMRFNMWVLASQTLTASLIQPAGALSPNGATAGLPSPAFLSANSIMKVCHRGFRIANPCVIFS